MKMRRVSIFTLISFIPVLVHTISFKEDVTLTAKEKDALDKFKLVVIPKIPEFSYLRNYVNDDIDDLYFIHWLRAQRLNIRLAEQMFINHLQWRHRENMDKIDNDCGNWAQFQKEYPVFYNDTVDKEGRPVAEVWFGEWNVRRGIIAGLSRMLIRYNQRILETLTRRVYKARAEGRHVSQAVLIVDMEGFNVVQQACKGCLHIYAYTATVMQNQYPYLFDNIIIVNAPPIFTTIERVLRPILRESLGATPVKIFSDRRQGLEALDKKIDKNQRSVRLRGTLRRYVPY